MKKQLVKPITFSKAILLKDWFCKALKDDIVKTTAGRFLTVEFEKANGENRVMNCRTGVTKHLRGGKSTTAHKADLLTVYDVQVGGYRSIPISRIKRITMQGKTTVFK